LAQAACDMQESNEISTDANESSTQIRAGILPRVESLPAGSISSAVTSVKETKRKEN